jgi:hypothetical protein
MVTYVRWRCEAGEDGDSDWPPDYPLLAVNQETLDAGGGDIEVRITYWPVNAVESGRRSADSQVIQGDGLDPGVRRAAMGPWLEPPGTSRGSAGGRVSMSVH